MEHIKKRHFVLIKIAYDALRWGDETEQMVFKADVGVKSGTDAIWKFGQCD